MSDITLVPMTKELIHRFYQDFKLDLDLFHDPDQYREYVYNEEECDKRLDRYRQLGRIYMAVMLAEKPIGEVVLKDIDHQKKCCTLGISLVNDSFKNKGYGTQAERLILIYAFEIMKMETVYADALSGNKRSQHVLKKVGFRETRRDEGFVYFRCDRGHSGS